jgi:RNA-binding protein 26
MYEHGENSIWVPPGKKPDEYDPSNAGLMTGVETNGMGSPGAFNTFRGNDRGRGRGAPRGDRGGAHGNASRRGGRAEFSSDRPNFDRSKTTIVVENIPEEQFSEEAVREFFSQFGNILEVSMRPYKRLSIVKYDSWDAAQAAYSSPKVIFDNRFVKVYWYTNLDALPQPPASATGSNGTPAKRENGSQGPVPARDTDEPMIDPEEFARKQEEAQKAHEEKAKGRSWRNVKRT